MSKIPDDHQNYWTAEGLKDITLTPIDIDSNFLNVLMNGQSFRNMLLEELNGIQIDGKNSHCLIEYVWEIVRGKQGFKKKTKQDLFKEFASISEDIDKRISTRNLIN